MSPPNLGETSASTQPLNKVTDCGGIDTAEELRQAFGSAFGLRFTLCMVGLLVANMPSKAM